MKAVNKKWVIPLAALVLTLSIAGAAFAATGSSSQDSTTAGDTATTNDSDAVRGMVGPGWGRQRSDETLLTGDLMDKAKAAALAKIGSDATVIRVETDADGHAAYEVHATQADGIQVTVYVDESYNVVSVETCAGPNGAERGHGRAGETALTGDTLTKAGNAAVAAAGTGSTVVCATTEDDGTAAYEVLVKKADGTYVIVYLDNAFNVVKTETAAQRGPEGGAGRMGGGHGRCFGDADGTHGAPSTNGNGATGTSTTGSV